MVVVSWVGGREDKRFYFDALTFHSKSKSAQRWGVWYVHCACIEGKKVLSLILKRFTDFFCEKPSLSLRLDSNNKTDIKS